MTEVQSSKPRPSEKPFKRINTYGSFRVRSLGILAWSIKKKNAVKRLVCPVDSIFKMCINICFFRRVSFS